MVNRDYKPTENEEKILAALKEGRSEGKPWGIANPLYIQKQTDINKQNLNYYLNNLVTAGWLKKPVNGLYIFAVDPREDD
jgi:DNA-binding IclR family transcriptional regulator